jgi:hypothetical protein
MEVTSQHNTCQDAWVVFCTDSDVPWLRILKRGFRHCMVVFHDGKHWLCIDPLSHMMDMRVIDGERYDMPKIMAAQGHTVLKTQCRAPQKIAPPDILSCVSIVKRILGIHSFFILTPWQLYKHLKRENACRNNNNFTAKKGDLPWD